MKKLGLKVLKNKNFPNIILSDNRSPFHIEQNEHNFKHIPKTSKKCLGTKINLCLDAVLIQ